MRPALFFYSLPMTTTTKIINGDCQTVLQRLRNDCVDLVVTDPPYLVNYQSRDGRSILSDKDGSWLRPAFTEIARVLKPHSYCVSFYGVFQAEQFLTAWKAVGLEPVAHFVWVKSYASSVRVVRRNHDCAYLLAKGRPGKPNEILTDVQSWSYSGNKLHPTQKPVSAIEPLIAAYSQPGEIVLDPFAGSGTTGVAARNLDRKFFGIELDPQYYEIAAQRLGIAA